MFTRCIVRDPRTALRPGTKTVRGRFVDDTTNARVQSRFVAAEVATDVRHDVHAGRLALKAARMIVSLAATRDGRHRPRIVFYDISAAFVHASIDEVGGCSLLEKEECFLLLKALYGTRMASKRWRRHYMRVFRTHGWRASKVMPGFFHHRDPAGTCGCHGDDFMAEGSDALLDRLDRVKKDEFNSMPRCWDVWAVVSSRKSSSSNGQCACMSKRCASVGVEAHDTSQNSPCCLDLQTLEL